MEYKILLVDDDPILLFLHQALLKKNELNYPIHTFKNGKEAWDFLKADAPGNIYLISLDINMPVMNGWELLEELKASQIASQVDVIILTSSIDKADKIMAATYRMVVAYLEKPLFKVDKLKEIIANRLHD